MMRILIIDNEDVENTHVRRLKSGVVTDLGIPDPDVKFIHVNYADSSVLQAEVEALAQEHWDAIMIDVNLFPEKEGLPPVLVPIAVIDGFRRFNRKRSKRDPQ